jgi:hypothetical protein
MMESTSNGSVPRMAKAEGSTSSINAGTIAGIDSLRALGSSALSSVLSSMASGGAAAPQIDSLRTHASTVWSSARSWGDFFDAKKFTPAQGLDDVRQRLLDNLQHFAYNYGTSPRGLFPRESYWCLHGRGSRLTGAAHLSAAARRPQ